MTRGSPNNAGRRFLVGSMWLGAMLALAGGTLFASGQAMAVGTTINVCPSCTYTTIQSAIAAAGSGARVQIAPGTYSGPLSIDKSLTLRGAGADQTSVSGGSPVVTIAAVSAVKVTIEGITITGGDSGIETTGGTVKLRNSLITQNGPYGGIYVGGGTVTLHNSPVTDNSGSEGGGIDQSAGSVTLYDSPVTANEATDGGGIEVSGGGLFSIHKSAISGNTASGLMSPSVSYGGQGGGIYVLGSGVLRIERSPVTNNSALTPVCTHCSSTGSAGGGIDNAGTAILTKSPVTSNSATGGDGGGIYNVGMLTLKKSPVTDNSPDDCYPAC